MATRKNRTRIGRRKASPLSAVAVVDMNGVTGAARFTAASRGRTRITYDFRGLTPGLHGFHIHQYGDLTEGCRSACAHFNPTGESHGGPYSKTRHAGDLGNVRSSSGVASGSITVKNLSIDPTSPNSVIGRAIVLHADQDDLGRGQQPESSKTGNAGRRVACAVIGLARGCG